MKNILGRLRRWRKPRSIGQAQPLQQERPIALPTTSAISRLPLELWLEVIDYLPIESVVALCLTCMHFKQQFKDDYFTHLACSPDDKVELLNLLAVDLSEYIACYHCQTLHRMKDIKRYSDHATWGINLQRPACVFWDVCNGVDIFSKFFSTTMFEMIIKSHKVQQPMSPEVQELMAGCIHVTSFTFDAMLCREKYRMVNESLLQKRERVYSYARRSGEPLYPLWHYVPVCCHVKFISHSSGPRFEYFNSPLRLQDDEFEQPWRITWDSIVKLSSGLRGCKRCRTEYRVDVESRDNGILIFITSWKNLGTDPDSDAWRQHNYIYSYARTKRFRAQKDPAVESSAVLYWPEEAVDTTVGTIVDAFEEGEDSRYDALLTSHRLTRSQRRFNKLLDV